MPRSAAGRRTIRRHGGRGRRALRVASHDEHSTIAKEIRVDLAATPILEWSWKALEVPAGPTFATAARPISRATWWSCGRAFRRRSAHGVAYAWGTSEPEGSVERSRKTGTVTFFILRSRPEDLGRWFTERRNLVEDYQRVYGERPDASPKVIAISIDTNDTHSRAAALIGAISFTGN